MTGETEAEFSRHIAATLAANPDWFRTAMLAAVDGMATALREANERAGRHDFALLCSLTLAAPHRLDANIKATLAEKIISAIRDGTSEVESETIARLSRKHPAGN